jgi:RNA polymerase sigma-70 factor (ECF subfamily)
VSTPGGALAKVAPPGEDHLRVESDEALLMAFHAGDARAFERLVARHEKPVWCFLRRFVKDSATAEDLLQEVFLRVVRSREGAETAWRGSAKFSTWLYTIARNLCIDQARRASHRDAASLDGPARETADDETTLHERVAASDPLADARAVDRQARVRIDRAIDALPLEQREVFLMREVMEMPFAEIAVAVGVSEPTVKSRMRYALEKLRVALAELNDDLSPANPPSAKQSTGSG